MQKFATVVLFVCLSTIGWTQIARNITQPAPADPATATPSPSLVAPRSASPSAVGAVAPSAVAVTVPTKPPKLFDRSFKLWTMASFAATVADIESTRNGISNCGAIEANPLLGSNPSRARLYAIGMPMTAGYNLLGLWMKRRWPEHRVWMLLPGSSTVVHTAAAAHNVALCH